MKKRVLLTALAALTVALGATAGTPKNHDWGYQGDISPEHWAELMKNFALCAKGKNQSPIDIHGAYQVAGLPKLDLQYHQRDAKSIINNDHSVQIDYSKGSEMSLDNAHYYLKQFHLHSPSENTINGHAFALEMHLVHADRDGQLAVLAVMFELGEANQEIDKIIHDFPERHQSKEALAEIVNVNKLLPAQKEYYQFNGSLTTPPCSEGVHWYVLAQPMTLSKAQLQAITSQLEHKNNRPVQPLNARIIVRN